MIYGSNQKGPRGYDFTVCDGATGRVLMTGTTNRYETIEAEHRDGRHILVGRKMDAESEYLADGKVEALVDFSDHERSLIEATLLAEIDRGAEVTRSLFITNTASQPAVYLAKENEARSFVANPSIPEDGTPHLTLEAARIGQGRAQVAAIIIGQADAWRQISAGIEEIRLTAKDTVRNAPTVAAMRDAGKVDWSTIVSLA